jgi:hypothetical protein
MLGLQARVIGNGGFTARSAPAGDDLRERFIQGQAPQATCLFGEFNQAVRRVGADRVNGLRRTGAQPVKAIGAFGAVQASLEYQTEGGLSFNYS